MGDDHLPGPFTEVVLPRRSSSALLTRGETQQREGGFPAMDLGDVLSPEFVKSGVGHQIAGGLQVLDQFGFPLGGVVD